MGFLSNLNRALKPKNLLKPKNAAKMLATGGLYAGSPQHIYDTKKTNDNELAAMQAAQGGQMQQGAIQNAYSPQVVMAGNSGINANDYYSTGMAPSLGGLPQGQSPLAATSGMSQLPPGAQSALGGGLPAMQQNTNLPGSPNHNPNLDANGMRTIGGMQNMTPAGAQTMMPQGTPEPAFQQAAPQQQYGLSGAENALNQGLQGAGQSLNQGTQSALSTLQNANNFSQG